MVTCSSMIRLLVMLDCVLAKTEGLSFNSFNMHSESDPPVDSFIVLLQPGKEGF